VNALEDGIEGDDPTYLTYHMMDWSVIRQVPSEDRCVACGRAMLRVDAVRNKAGKAYEGWVCHPCRSLTWVRAD
jgi:uncharacterized protein with PIN domain